VELDKKKSFLCGSQNKMNPLKSGQEKNTMQKISPFLWFNTQAEEAMNFYTSVFKDAKIVNVSRGPDGKVFTGSFELFGQEFMVLNAGPQFKFNEAISFFVKCKDQEEVDYYWQKLTADGGQESQCGWLKDKFGLSWQIIPDALGKLLGDPDPSRSQRAMQAMMQMQKIDVAKLEAAADGK
jgi:predicted 3-demethylubiquinone-9 3-methyltransferase (glyoxalase superfamily)